MFGFVIVRRKQLQLSKILEPNVVVLFNVTSIKNSHPSNALFPNVSTFSIPVAVVMLMQL